MATGPTQAQDDDVDVLIVGAGPSGLALAVELQRFGIRFRLIDRRPGPVHETRALAIQPRTLEVLAPSHVAGRLVEHGRTAVQLRLHVGARERPVALFEGAVTDTAYPYLLFLSQAETERLLAERLDEQSVVVERGLELVELSQIGAGVHCTLRAQSGQTSGIHARFVVGSDGAHSAVRHLAGLGFRGQAFPQTFGLADLEVDGLAPQRVHAFLAGAGILFFFPIGIPASWRMIAMLPTGTEGAPSLATLQAAVEAHTAKPLLLHDVVWATTFAVNSRSATRFQSRRVFLIGDAAHIHSPAGAQGMNTGIQDAVNLAWKLALVCRGTADRALLRSYDAERRPVARQVIRVTNRAFRVAMSRNTVVRFIRTRVASRLVPLALGSPRLRTLAFRTIGELNLHYSGSSLSVEGKPRLRRGPRAGRRLPDGPVLVDGETTTLHHALEAPFLHVLLCGASESCAPTTARLAPWAATLRIHRLTTSASPGAIVDSTGEVFRRLGLKPGEVALMVVRPDGHIGYRAAGTDLSGLAAYLRRSLRLHTRP